jgi:hypothetical protein
MRRALAVFAVFALFAPVAATGERASTAKTPKSVLAIQGSKRGDFLVRLNGDSLKRTSRRVSLGGWASYTGWSFSPDGRRLALGVDEAYGFRIYDVRPLRRVAEIGTWSKSVSFLAWVTPRRVIGYEPPGFFVADPVTGRKVASPQLSGAPVSTPMRAGNVVVVLSAPPLDIGNASLAVIDAQGRLRSVQLAGIKAGAHFDPDSLRGESYIPGLAVDPARRGFVVGGRDEPVAEVDLKTLAVTYHHPQQSRSFLSRFHDWLEPVAGAKGPLTGSFRKAVWVGDGRIAIRGFDTVPAGGEQVQTSWAGLSVVDTGNWTRRMVDPDAHQAAFAANTILGSGPHGLSGYSSDGDRLYHLFEGQNVGVAASLGSRAFVVQNKGPVRIVDATSGRVLGAHRGVPRLLHPDFTWW